MRILFVSGTVVGGSGRSQRELAARLRSAGHEIQFLVDLEGDDQARRWAYEQLSDLAARWGTRPGASLIRAVERLPGRRSRMAEVDGLRHATTAIPENAAAAVLDDFRPDIVIGNSVLRLTWRKIAALCRARGVATVLYVREVESLNHFEGGARPADAVVANAASLCRQVEAFGGECSLFPSVIEVEVTRVATSRDVALAINPIASRGVEVVWELARRLREMPIVVQESWPLSAEQLAGIEVARASLPNVELRRAEPPGGRLYRDARVLLVPYLVDNRPRVILEAQANGIPVIAGDSPSLVESVGPGGIVVDTGDLDGWCQAVESLWRDQALYERLAIAAARHSERDEVSPSVIARRFERFLVDVTRKR